ncbi:MAG: hypothetical protein ACX94A_05025, partial [Algiphilus sp.]
MASHPLRAGATPARAKGMGSGSFLRNFAGDAAMLRSSEPVRRAEVRQAFKLISSDEGIAEPTP